MKIKQGYKVRKMCDTAIVVAVGTESSEFNGMITLNDSGELLWSRLTQGADIDELAQLLVAEYGIDKQTAMADVEEFVEKIEGAGFLEQ